MIQTIDRNIFKEAKARANAQPIGPRDITVIKTKEELQYEMELILNNDSKWAKLAEFLQRHEPHSTTGRAVYYALAASAVAAIGMDLLENHNDSIVGTSIGMVSSAVFPSAHAEEIGQITSENGVHYVNQTKQIPLLYEIGQKAFDLYEKAARDNLELRVEWLNRQGKSKEAKELELENYVRKGELLQSKLPKDLLINTQDPNTHNQKYFRETGYKIDGPKWFIDHVVFENLDAMIGSFTKAGKLEKAKPYLELFKEMALAKAEYDWKDRGAARFSFWEQAAELTMKVDPKLGRERFEQLARYFQRDDVIEKWQGHEEVYGKAIKYWEKAGNKEEVTKAKRTLANRTSDRISAAKIFEELGDNEPAQAKYLQHAFSMGLLWNRKDPRDVGAWAERNAWNVLFEVKGLDKRYDEFVSGIYFRQAARLGESLEKTGNGYRAQQFYRNLVHAFEGMRNRLAAKYFWDRIASMDEIFTGSIVREAHDFFEKGLYTKDADERLNTISKDQIYPNKDDTTLEGECAEAAYKTGRLMEERRAEPQSKPIKDDIFNIACPTDELLQFYSDDQYDAAGKMIKQGNPIKIDGTVGRLGAAITMEWDSEYALRINEPDATTYVYDFRGNGDVEAVFREERNGKSCLIAEKATLDYYLKEYPPQLREYLKEASELQERLNQNTSRHDLAPGVTVFGRLYDACYFDLKMKPKK